MKVQSIGIWVLLVTASMISALCYATASMTRTFHEHVTGGVQIPGLSEFFLSGSLVIYLFPVPWLIWAIVGHLKKWSPKQQLLLHTCILASSLLFLAAFVCATILPFAYIVVTPVLEN